MSKLLEFDAILKENLKDIHFRSPDQTYEAVLYCMKLSYNRAIDDAAKSVELKIAGKHGQLGIDKDSILRLKI